MIEASIRAVFDLGTNSVRLLLLRVSPDRLEPLFDAQRITRLGENFAETGKLSPEAIQRTLNIISRLSSESIIFRSDSCELLATNILREVSNPDDLIQPLFQRFGIRVRVLTPEEEAVAGFFAVRFDYPKGSLLTLDIGGSTIELAMGVGDFPDQCFSLPLGPRLLEEKFPTQAPTPVEELELVSAHVRSLIKSLPNIPEDFTVVLIGGVGKALGGYAKTLMGAPGSLVADRLYPETLQRLVRLLAGLSLDERSELPGTDPERSDIMLYGAIVARELISHLQADHFHVSLAGLQLGVFNSELKGIPLDPIRPRIQLPSLSFPPVNKKKRKEEIVFLLRTPDDCIWLQTKEHYPEEVYRLPSGGIKPSENCREAALREITEETGFANPRPIPLSTLDYCLDTNPQTAFTSHLFLVEVEDRPPVSMDDREGISGWKLVTKDELTVWGKKLKSLSGEFRAWGVFRAAALYHALELAKQRRW